MVTLEEITDFSEFYEENKQDIVDHYKEYSDHFGEGKEIDLDTEIHQNLILSGVLHCYKILYDGEYAGYFSLTVSPSMLLIGDIEVTINHIFVKPEYRGKGVSQSALKLLEDFLAGEGLESYNVAFPDTEGHRAFADKLGMKATSTNFIKVIRSN